MKGGLNSLPARESDRLVNVVVDTPRGSRNKYKLDAKLQVWRLSKVLTAGAVFPYDFGFIPSTEGADGDPIDVLVLNDEPAFVGCVLPILLIGVVEAEQTGGHTTVRNDRLLGVIETKQNPPVVQSIAELAEWRLKEIEHFFVSYNAAEGKDLTVIGRGGPERAEELLAEAMIG